jgi:hypothetical protein
VNSLTVLHQHLDQHLLDGDNINAEREALLNIEDALNNSPPRKPPAGYTQHLKQQDPRFVLVSRGLLATCAVALEDAANSDPERADYYSSLAHDCDVAREKNRP